jgi:hypothetical protein
MAAAHEITFDFVIKKSRARVWADVICEKTKFGVRCKWYGLPWLPLLISRELIEYQPELFKLLPRGWDLRRVGFNNNSRAYIYKRGRYV